MAESLGYIADTFTHDNLISGHTVLVTEEGILASGENRTRGALCGKITASGKLVLSDDGAVDGSEVPDRILAKDTDASAADVTTIFYVKGEFNSNEMTFGGAHTADSVREGLRGKGIFMKAAIAQ